MSLTPVGDLGIALKADIDDYQKSMATASDLTAGFRGTVRSLASSVRNMGAAMTIGAGLAGAALVTLTQRAERVSSAFREVDTLIAGVSNAEEKYGELVSDLNTKFGLQADKMEVIEGLYQSISAGVDKSTQAQRSFLETAAELAVVGRVDLGTSVDVLSTVMNIYGYEASQADEISESLFQTIIFGKTRMEELAPVLGRVAALGSNLGVQIDEIGASMGVLTRTGFGARVAATGLRNIFRSMLKPSEKMQETLFQIAAEQDFFAEQIEGSTQRIKGLAKNFRDAGDAVSKFAEKQAAARKMQENASTAIQEARLKMTAIQQDRIDQLPQLTNEQVKQADSIKELEQVIENYQFKVNKARLEEKRFRKQKEESQAELESYKNEMANIIATSGNFGKGIGQLILENQNFVDTMVALREKVNNTELAMTDLFPRTRALQGALALVGEDGQMLMDIFSEMEDGTFDVAEAWDEMSESAQESFGSFEEFKQATRDVTAGDLEQWFEKAQGPQQQLRNSISQLKEAISGLGQIFTGDVVDSIVKFSDAFVKAVEKFENLDEKIRESISRFTVLAVAIGLVLGPLMFFGGQMAIIISLMGTTFIPFAIALAGAFGIFATALSSAAAGGEDSKQTFASMGNIFGGLIEFINLLKTHFMGVLLPALKFLGNTFIDIFNEIKNQFEASGEVEGLDTLVFRLAWALREGIVAIGSFLQNNKELIASLIVLAVDTLLNKIIPAVIQIATAFITYFLPILMETAEYVRAEIIPAIIEFLPTFDEIVNAITTGLIPAFAKISSEGNSTFLPMIKELVTIFINRVAPAIVQMLPKLQILAMMIVNHVIPAFADLLQGVLAILKEVNWEAIAAFFGLFISLLIMAIPPIMGVVSFIGKLLEFLSPLIGLLITAGAILAPLIATWVKFSAAILTAKTVIFAIIKAVTFLISAIAVLAGIPFWAAAAIVAGIAIILATIWHFRDEIMGVMEGVIEYFKNLTLKEIIMASLDPFGWGEHMIKALAKGMKSEFPALRKAAQKAVDTVKNWLGFGSAPPALGEDYNPETWGSNLTTSFASSIEGGTPEVKAATGDLTDASIPDIEEGEYSGEGGLFDFSGSGKDGVGDFKGMSGMGGDTYKIEFTEGSIEVGPFHGISDEELPEKVERAVNRSLNDVIDEVKGSGKDATSSMAPGGQVL